MTHSLKFFFTGVFGDQTWPEFVAMTTVDDVEVIYCDSNTRGAEPKQDWMTKLLEEDPAHKDTLSEECRVGHSSFSSNMREWMKSFNHSEGKKCFYSTLFRGHTHEYVFCHFILVFVQMNSSEVECLLYVV